MPAPLRPRRAIALAGACAAGWLVSPPALAAPPQINLTPDLVTTPGAANQDFFTGLGRRATLLGTIGGLRTALSADGIDFGLEETSEILGNLIGGARTGADYDGLTQAVVQLDTARAFGWHGGTFDVSALQVHGRNLSSDNLQSLQTASGIEADRSTRLWELWYQQKFLADDAADIKIGQQSIDQEFMVIQNGATFVNTMFGWPMVPSVDFPGGGPAYPLSALGIRLRARLASSVTVLAGVFSGSPAPTNSGDPQRTDGSGTSFPLDRGVLAIAELQYAYPGLGAMVTPGAGTPLARTYRFGAWYDSERFDDLAIDASGRSLADPSSDGVARRHRGDYGLYATADQLLWVDGDDTDRTLNAFLRLEGAPQADRNLVSFSLNAGLTLHDPFPSRDDDTVGIGMGFAQVGGAAADYDRAVNNIGGTPIPVQGGETFVELTYQYQVMPWWQLQPDAQYVFNPGGGVADPNDTTKRIGDEFVVGLRTNVAF